MRVKDNSAAFTRSWATRIGSNMQDVGQELKSSIIELIKIESPPHSMAGEPPHVDIDDRHDAQHPGQPHLVDSWTVRPDSRRLSVSVASTVPWSVDTDLGYDMDGPRPYAVQSLLNLKLNHEQEFLEALLQ
jgi:hypothetical protein